jgi:hypothetical protein
MRSKALARSVPTQALKVVPEDLFKQGVVALAERLSGELTPIILTETYELIQTYEKALGKISEIAKKNLKAFVETNGLVEEGSKQKVATIGEYQVTCRPVRTTFDPKRVEALLRAKNMNVEKGMDREISYTVNESKLQSLITTKKMTADEVESCRYPLTYSLQPPMKISLERPDESEER